MTTFIAYITATFMIEAISVSNAVQTEAVNEVFSNTGQKDAKSHFFIESKVEIGVIAGRVTNKKWVKNLILAVLIVYMYGAICLKFVGGAESFEAGINHTFWDEEDGFRNWLGFDPYYFGLFVFGFFSIYFSFGNIENAKTLQIVTTIIRFVVTILMCFGSVYYIEKTGTHEAPVFAWSHQIKYLAQVFGNTTFAFVYHHSVSGIVAPVRPQN